MLKLSADEKKSLIIDTCKELFYAKGFVETSYEDICSAAGLPPGSVTYYFTGKNSIAETIQCEYELKLKNMIAYLANDEYELRVMSAVETLNWWSIFFNNTNIGRFIADINNEGVLRKAMQGDVEHFFKLHVSEYGLNIGTARIRMMCDAHIGLITELLQNISENLSAYNAEEVAGFVIECDYKLLNVDGQTITNIINQARSVYNNLTINDEYLKNFKYDESVL